MKTFSLLTLSLLLAAPLLAEKVALQKEEGRKAALLVNGQPFEIHGVGGGGSLEKLKSSGGNAIRTWAIDENTGALLDEAQAKGIKVALGFWLGHERHGFSYTDWDSNITQAENLFAAVRKHKDHPAVLLWALGNEMEGFKETSNPAIYTQIEYLARKVKEIDPDHPIMSITAEIGKKQIEGLNRFCPSVDIHGINSYGGGPSIP
ncbi:glycosyl hydrolase, partial [bacterium]|nr:glycosyl hydrolase [bacterium]